MSVLEEAVEQARQRIEGDDANMHLVILCFMQDPRFQGLMLNAYRAWTAPCQGHDIDTLQRQAAELKAAIGGVFDGLGAQVRQHAAHNVHFRNTMILLHEPAFGEEHA